MSIAYRLAKGRTHDDSLRNRDSELMSPHQHDQRQPARSFVRYKPSSRKLKTVIRLDSSEATPSEHSSLYDAGSEARSSLQVSSSLSEPERDIGHGNGDDGFQTRASNGTPALELDATGTQLFTITEHDSVATLKTVPSNQTFQCRIPTFSPYSTDVLREPVGQQGSSNRKRDFSLDENTSRKVHHRTGSWPGNRTDTTSVSNSNDTALSGQTPKAFRPPFPPPERKRTPLGIPRWPGERDSPQPTRPAWTSTRVALYQYLRHRRTSGLKFRHIYRQARAPRYENASGSQRVWRPPASGHNTNGFTDLRAHPFTRATVAESSRHSGRTVATTSATGPEDHRSAARIECYTPSGFPGEIQALPMSRVLDGLVQNRSKVQPACSPSQRALSAAAGNAVPVSPARALASTTAAQAARRASLPEALSRSPAVLSERVRRSSVPVNTMRTIDVIDQFPAPPSAVQNKPKAAKAQLWSLFPRANGGSEQSTGIRNHLTDGATELTRSPPPGPFAMGTSQAAMGMLDHMESLPRNPLNCVDADGVACSTGNSNAGNIKIVSSGTGDANGPHGNHLNGTRAPRPLSEQNVIRQSSSRSGRALGSWDISGTYPKDERDRALANGALRFLRSVERTDSTDQGSPLPDLTEPNPNLKSQSRPNRSNANEPLTGSRGTQLPTTAGTLASAGRLCGHGRVESLPRRVAPLPTPNLDGPDDESTTCEHGVPTPVAPTNHVNTDDPGDNVCRQDFKARPPGTLLRAIQARATWRTRMQKTRCWRCDLQNQKLRGWDRVRRACAWTCFGRFQAYDESDGEAAPAARAVRTGIVDSG